MYCPHCGKSTIVADAKFCSFCARSLNNNQISEPSITQGNDGINVSNNEIRNSDVNIAKHIDKRNYDNRRIKQIVKEKIPEFSRSFDIKTPVKSFWILIGALISTGASIVTIIDFYSNNLKVKSTNFFDFFNNKLIYIPLSFLSLAFGVLLIALWWRLYRERYFMLPFYSLELDKEGHVHLTKPAGKCPECNAPISVRFIDSIGSQGCFAKCKRNPSHKFVFDHTKLPKLKIESST